MPKSKRVKVLGVGSGLADLANRMAKREKKAKKKRKKVKRHPWRKPFKDGQADDYA